MVLEIVNEEFRGDGRPSEVKRARVVDDIRQYTGAVHNGRPKE
jgi:hypothetical protein